MRPTNITLNAVVARHHPNLPRYVVVPSRVIAAWRLEETTTVIGTVNDIQMGRRSLKRWDDERWFLDLPEKLCREAAVDKGDRVTLVLTVASDELPEELSDLLASSAVARTTWDRMTRSEQRMIREQVFEAKRADTRSRRARRALGLER